MQEDSIEHYAGCKYCVGFLRRRLHYQGPIDRGHLVVLGVNRCDPRPEDVMRLALWSYMVYRAFNRFRTAGRDHLATSEVEGVMEGYLREGISGHEGATRFLHHCWDRSYTHLVSVSRQESVEDDPIVLPED